MLPRKIFENLHTAMAILVLFNNFEGKFVIFLAPYFECFTKYNAFCSRNFNYACPRRIRHIAMNRFEIMEKFYSYQTLLKMASGEMHTQHTPHPSCIRLSLYINKKWPQILREVF